MKKIFIAALVCAAVVGYAAASDLQYSNSAFSYTDGVVDFSDTGISENVRSNDFETSTPADLVVGSVFVDVDGAVKKVTKIETASDGTVTLTTIQPEITEAFDYMYIPDQDLTVQIDDLASLLDEGSVQYADGSASRATFHRDGFEVALDKDKKCRVGITDINGAGTVTLNIGYSLPSTETIWKKKWIFWYIDSIRYNRGYIRANYNHNFGLQFSIQFSAETNDDALEQDLPIYTVGASQGLEAGIYAAVSVGGSITAKDTITLRNIASATCGCALDGLSWICWPSNPYCYGSSKTYFGNELSVEASTTVKTGLKLKIESKVGSYVLASVSLGGGPYEKLSGEFKYNFRYNTLADNSFDADQDIKTDGWHFDAYPEVSCSLTAGLYTEGEASVFDEKWKTTFLDTDTPKVTVFEISNK